MISSKKKLAVRIIRALHGGNVSAWSKIDPREVYEAIESARNQLMEAFVQKNGSLDGEFITSYSSIPVVCDDTTAQKYSVLPARLISFSTYDGVRLISPMFNQANPFIKVANGFLPTFSGLEASGLGGKTGYYLERHSDGSVRAYYINIPHDYQKVLIKMVSSTYSFGEDDNLPVPAEFEQPLAEMVYAFMARQYGAPTDKLSDLEPIN